jgi:hypothetical protein
MADIDLQTVLNSGNISGVNLGGTASTDAVQDKGESDIAYLPFENSETSLIAETIQAALEELANIGYAHMVLATPYTGGQTQTATPIKISAFDTIHHEANGAVTPLVDTSESVHTHKFTIEKAGVYNVYGTITAEFSSSNDMTIELYKNGNPTGAKANLQGRGTGKAVQFTYIGDFEYDEADFLELYAFADSGSISLLITSSTMTIQRKVF